MQKKLKRLQYWAVVFFFIFCFTVVQTDMAVSELPSENGSGGLPGAGCMHGDMYSSDTTPLPGPGVAKVGVTSRLFLAACSTVLIRSDGKPFVLGTNMLNREPVVRLLDPADGCELARLNVDGGSLLGGVYAYLDDQDRLVMVDGSQNLIRIQARQTKTFLGNRWTLSIGEKIPLAAAVTKHCGGGDCDAVVSISPGSNGAIWFVTQHALAGLYQPNAAGADPKVSTLKLGPDERIDNSFSTTGNGLAAIVTNTALYVLRQKDGNHPKIVWRKEYDAGSARKPGQLSHGSGATPTFFGPDTGMEFVTITDNADDKISVIVHDTATGRVVCKKPIFLNAENSGTENSAIAVGNTVIVASTYGYPYPALPEGVGPSVPETADFVGGMVSVDCAACEVAWENTVRSAAVPKLSTADGMIYTVERKPVMENALSMLDTYTYHFTVIDADTGEVLKQTGIKSLLMADTLQMAGNIGADEVFWQGNMSGIVRIAP